MTLDPVSVVIPTRGDGGYLQAAIGSVTRTQVCEIIIVSKTAINLGSLGSDRRIKVLVRSEAGLSAARNIGISESSNDIVAFTDDDCTVPKDWPQPALQLFRDPKVGAVGGPGITDQEDDWRSKCAGAVLSSYLGTSSSIYRYWAMSGHPKPVGEKQLSTCNLLFRKRALEELGYFHTGLQTCEENELIERIRSVGYKVLYSPSCIVYHHRRPLFVPFLRQISAYAKGRVAYTLNWPKHLSPTSVVPSILVLSTLCLPLLWVLFRQIASFLVEILAIYMVAMAIAALRSTAKTGLNLKFTPVVFSGLVAMHYCYGLSFLIGLLNSVKMLAQ